MARRHGLRERRASRNDFVHDLRATLGFVISNADTCEKYEAERQCISESIIAHDSAFNVCKKEAPVVSVSMKKKKT